MKKLKRFVHAQVETWLRGWSACQNRVRCVRVLVVLLVSCGSIGLFLSTSVAQAEGPFASASASSYPGPGIFNHPVGVKPSSNVTIPKGWPLDMGGTLACITCHKAMPARINDTIPMLRGESDTGFVAQSFCVNCHTDRRSFEASAIHWSGVSRAHLKPTRGSRGNMRLASFNGLGLDSESRRCILCHDGNSATDATNTAHGSFASSTYSDMGKNHPIGMSYPPRNLKKYQSRYRSAQMLPREIRLPNGKVGCTSCHDLYSNAPAKLTKTTEASKLCFSCHQM